MCVITCQVSFLEVNKFSPAANTYDIGTTIGKAPAISISGRDKEPAECKYQIYKEPMIFWGFQNIKSNTIMILFQVVSYWPSYMSDITVFARGQRPRANTANQDLYLG